MPTQYEVHRLDADGQVTATDTFATFATAFKFAQRIAAPASVAVVVDRHRIAYTECGERVWDTETVWHTGSESALLAWGG